MTTDLDGAQRARLGSGQSSAVLIIDLPPDGPAGRAGLRLLDIVVGVDGLPTPSTAVLETAIGERAPGQRVAIDFLRDGQRRRTTAILTA